MTKSQLLRLHLRNLKMRMIERIYDLWNITLPIFLTSGILVACFKFWLWVF